MAGLMLVFGLGFTAIGILMVGTLGRLANAIEAQNEHYGIADVKPAEPQKDAA